MYRKKEKKREKQSDEKETVKLYLVKKKNLGLRWIRIHYQKKFSLKAVMIYGKILLSGEF